MCFCNLPKCFGCELLTYFHMTRQAVSGYKFLFSCGSRCVRVMFFSFRFCIP